MRKIFFVIGPSGSGKTTLVNNAIQTFDSKYGLKRIISATTRRPRNNEIKEESFKFLSDFGFDNQIKLDNFIEWEEYAELRHGLLKDSLISDCNLIKEITASGLSKVIEYATEHNFRDEIVVISIATTEDEIVRRLKQDRNMQDKEIKMRQDAEREHASKVDVGYLKINHRIYNMATKCTLDSVKKEFNAIIESYLKENKENEKMLIIHPGYQEIKRKDNPDGKFIHILVDSESVEDKVYYTTWNKKTGKRMGCDCPQAAMFPYKACKHQKAVIEQRLLGE